MTKETIECIEVVAVLQLPKKVHEHINAYARSKNVHPDTVLSHYVISTAGDRIQKEEFAAAVAYNTPEELLAALAHLQTEQFFQWTNQSIEAHSKRSKNKGVK